MMLIMPLVIQAIADADDRQCMEQLYTEYHRLMLSTAWTYIKSKADVEDIVSDSCLSLLKKIDALRDMERNALRYYIVATVRNASIDYCRRQQADNAKFQQKERETLEQIPDQTNIERKILLEEELQMVQQAIAHLPEHERAALQLKFQQGKKDCEIAQIIGVSESSVRKYIERARQHLKNAIY